MDQQFSRKYPSATGNIFFKPSGSSDFHVTLPTSGDRLLDVVVSDDAILVRNVLVSDSAGISDHRLITAVVQRPLHIESSIRRLTRRNFSKLDTATFESDSNVAVSNCETDLTKVVMLTRAYQIWF